MVHAGFGSVEGWPFGGAMIRVSQLSAYPIKACRGTKLESMELDVRGPSLDRRFMIVRPSGECVTQREIPRLALIRPIRLADSISLHAPGMPELSIRLEALESIAERLEVRVWGFRGEAILVSEEADRWLSELLGVSLRLVGCAPQMDRLANPEWAGSVAPIGFSDGYPILLISEESLDVLNQAIRNNDPNAVSLSMERFRPNIVVSGCPAFAEDDWVTLRVGEVVIDVVKPCDRCAVTTIDPETTESGKEPLATLVHMRRSDQGVLFGQNCVVRRPGTLRLASEVEVLKAGRLADMPEAWRVQSV